jgi:TrmH family RNA methyltransferase
MSESHLQWRVVLVRPRNPLNVGAAARAMANFGLRDLTVVAPHSPVWREARSAVGAGEVLKSARAVSDLAEAIGDATLALGTTSGTRRNLDREPIPLSRLAPWLKERSPRHRRVALLFGSEKTGLSNEHLSYCHALVRIPTSARCPSMNLGQAVAVCCYELARAGFVTVEPRRTRAHLSDPANLQALDHVFERAARVLDQVGFLKPKSRSATLTKLRRLLLDLELTNNDVKILGGVLAQIEWKLKTEKTRVGSERSGR